MVQFSTTTKKSITKYYKCSRRILAFASSFIRTRRAGRRFTLIATLFGAFFLARTTLFGTETEHPNVPKGPYHYPNSAQSNSPGGLKVMLFVTTQMSLQHIWFLKSCWPPALQNSVLLNTADVVAYLNPNKEERKEAMDILKHTFRDQNLTIHVRDNPGYQEGAMAALKDATREGWFSGYDWVIRVNPDVIIRNDTFIVDVMQNDPNATGLLINCLNFTNTNDLKIHTDFFAIKPGVLPSGAFLNPAFPNAERSFTNDIREAILNKGNHRWIPGAHPVDEGICRAGYDYYDSRKMEETHVIHFHQEEELMANNFTCPIPF
jgi:hypothetical protein